MITSPWYSLHPYPEVPLFRYLEEAATRHPARPCLITPGGPALSFAQVNEAARRASRLLRPDATHGDRVVFLAPNSTAYAVALYGAMMAGATVVPVNPLLLPAELEPVLRDAEPTVAFVSAETRPVIEALRPGTPSLRAVHVLDDLWTALDALPGGADPVAIAPRDDIAALVLSSGTTGSPKGVMLSHFNLVANLRQTLAAGMSPPYSGLLNYMPFFHVYGFAAIMGQAFAMGLPQVIIPRFDPALILQLSGEYRVHTLFSPPPALRGLIAARKAGAPSLTSYTRLIITGAAATPPDLWDEAESVFGIPVCQPYGLSEATAAANINPIHRIKRGTVGPPLPDTEQRLVDLETGQDVPPGGQGEVWVRGPQVMRGYWRRPEATANCLTPDGWLRTGDLGRFDEDGYLTIVDRLKEMIRYKAHQVAPSDLEAVLLTHPAVADVAVIPRADAEAGEIPLACVVLGPGATAGADDLLSYVNSRVNPIHHVRALAFVDAIPRNPSGKILRRLLIEKERSGSL
ncbi:MAG: AMP-binding protein [Dehalococcoidia bacterium]|nr:AMP-binding protein [Dehalococcoidia bacterium]